MKKIIKSTLTMIVIISICVTIRYVYVEYFTPKQIINTTEEAKIIDLKYSFAKAPIYNVIVDTKDTNREFKFTVPKDEYEKLKVNQNIKINYNYAVFPHYVDTVNDVIIID
jgi:hypothetical protein